MTLQALRNVSVARHPACPKRYHVRDVHIKGETYVLARDASNQQKVVISKCLAIAGNVLVLSDRRPASTWGRAPDL